MIKKISINKTTTYEKNVEITPKKINFFYGNNGAGKTTVAKLIENPRIYKNSHIEWEENPYEVLAYNREFVKVNFNNETAITGIYTLGEDSQEKLDKIEELKKQRDTHTIQAETNKQNLSKETEAQQRLRKDTVQKFWNKYKKQYCDSMKELYKGSISSMDAFFDKCLTVTSLDDNISFEEISNDYNTIYAGNLEEREKIKILDINEFNKTINNVIFKEEITENKNITLSKLINDLNNSTWIKEGLKYLKNSHNKCPFCQNSVSTEFIQQIQDLYGEKYQEQISILNEQINIINIFYENAKKIIEDNAEVFDNRLIIEFNKYMEHIKEEFNKKIDSPKYICSFQNEIYIGNLIEVNNSIQKENDKITEQNNKIKDINNSKKELVEKAWKFIRIISHDDISEYIKSNNDYIDKIKMLQEICKKDRLTLIDIDNKIQEIENSISGIGQTIGKINATLKQFNFKNFSLKENEDHLTYSIIRPNGEDASQTLSEGEFSFISFLYFYHLVFGSRNKSGLDRKHVLVIDDPVTSMDSNVLFIISTLIRNLINLCIDGKRNIEQIFIMSHNIYFFKEVSYKYGSFGNKTQKNKYNFFVVQKVNGCSSIEDKGYENPIKNSYELLWQSIKKRNFNDEANLNTMRRILEQ